MNFKTLHLILLLTVGSWALNLDTIQANRWYEINLPTQYRPWNNLQSDGHNLIFYSGVSSARGGDYCIYANALYQFNLSTQAGGVIKQNNYYCELMQTLPVPIQPDDSLDPTPKDRHVYNQFAYSAADSAVYLLHGASGSNNHPHDFWRYSLASGKWDSLGQAPGPTESWDLGGELNLIAVEGELWFFLNCRDIWVWNIAARTWTLHTVGTDRYAIYPIGPRGLYDPVRRRFAFYGSNCCADSTQWSNQMTFFSRDSLHWETRAGPVKTQYAALEYDSKWDRYLLAKGAGNDSVRVFNPRDESWSTAPIQGTLFNGYQYVEFVYAQDLDILVNEKEGHFYVARYQPSITGRRLFAPVARSFSILAQKVHP